MGMPDKPDSTAPEGHEAREGTTKPPLSSVGTREAKLMEHALASLASAPKPPETAEKVPSIGEQLALICDVGKMLRMTASSDREKIAFWEAYKKCVDAFRGAIQLPPLDKVSTTYKFRIASAMERGNGNELMRIFDEEKKEYAKPPWYKRVPGFNFLFGVAGGAGEIGLNLYELGKQGVKAATGDEQAREVLKRVGRSFLELDKVFAAVIRKDEYAKSIQEGGDETGYVLGKSAFDIASAILTGGAAGAAGKGLAIGGHGAREAAHMAGHVAGHVVAEGVHVASHGVHGAEEHPPEGGATRKQKLTKKPEKRV